MKQILAAAAFLAVLVPACGEPCACISMEQWVASCEAEGRIYIVGPDASWEGVSDTCALPCSPDEGCADPLVCVAAPEWDSEAGDCLLASGVWGDEACAQSRTHACVEPAR